MNRWNSFLFVSHCLSHVYLNCASRNAAEIRGGSERLSQTLINFKMHTRKLSEVAWNISSSITALRRALFGRMSIKIR